MSSSDSQAAADLKPGPYVCLSVKDSGHGMDKELLDRIFEPYFTTKPEGEGTGMGLSVVHGIVKSHGGDIVVESEKGVGTTFLVFFPKMEAPDESRKETEGKRGVPKGHERILLVDDEKDVTEVMEQMLSELGYRVTCKNDPISALECFKLRHFSYDLVISDMTMPKMTGMQLVSEMHRINPDIPVIMATGNRREISPEQAAQIGIKVFLMKPHAIGDLARAVRDTLDNTSKDPKKLAT